MNEESDRVSVLMVDDKEEKIVSLEAALNDLGLDVVRARSGREALRCLLRQDFAVILLDVNMPGMDGFETASLIRQRKNSESTPIIFITAYGDEPYVSRGYAMGAVDYILTPIIPEVLRTKVGVFVELYRKNREVRLQAEKLRQRAEQLAALATELTETEQRERRRLAQVIHDNLQQLLIAARMRLSAHKRESRAGASRIVAQVDELLAESIEVSRTLTTQLSPPILYDLGLVPALEWLAATMHQQHGLTVKVEGQAEAELRAEAPRLLAFEAVRELLFNAVKHSGVKEALVMVARTTGAGIRVVVQDSGAGFDPRILESPKSRAQHFGLFNIGERVRCLNGRMEIVSRPGEGTSISIELFDATRPPAEAEAAQPAERPRKTVDPLAAPIPAVPVHTGAKIRVMLADDHKIIRSGLASLLQREADIDVVGEAVDGPTAIASAQQLKPDVIIMDVSMPGMSGIEATRQVKRLIPNVRIIGLSMHTQAHMAAAMQRAGASAYLSKGGPAETLLEEIRRAELAGDNSVQM